MTLKAVKRIAPIPRRRKIVRRVRRRYR
jgi:hypothetical protein